MKKTTERLIAKIDPSKHYNLTQIVRENLMGYGKRYFTCHTIINNEMWLDEKKRILNAVKLGNGKGTSYHVKGQNLIKYLKSID